MSDTFTEMVAAPWFARAAAGTPALAVWLRSLGARIGRGVWCDSYWLPEPDLVTLGDGSTVNRGCVVQTHLFHDRIMSMDTVELEAGATLGPHSVILPAATIGAHATVGPASLVMRGETVPVGSRWSGNPIGPWRAVKVRALPVDIVSAHDHYAPQSGDPTFDVESYELDLSYRVRTNRLEGRAVINAVAAFRRHSVALDLIGLRATRVRVDGDRRTAFAAGTAQAAGRASAAHVSRGSGSRSR